MCSGKPAHACTFCGKKLPEAYFFAFCPFSPEAIGTWKHNHGDTVNRETLCEDCLRKFYPLDYEDYDEDEDLDEDLEDDQAIQVLADHEAANVVRQQAWPVAAGGFHHLQWDNWVLIHDLAVAAWADQLNAATTADVVTIDMETPIDENDEIPF